MRFFGLLPAYSCAACVCTCVPVCARAWVCLCLHTMGVLYHLSPLKCFVFTQHFENGLSWFVYESHAIIMLFPDRYCQFNYSSMYLTSCRRIVFCVCLSLRVLQRRAMLRATCTQKMASSDAHKTVKAAQLWIHSPLPFPCTVYLGLGHCECLLSASHLGFLPHFPGTCLQA